MENVYKNILNFGRTRAGKSTLAAKISQALPYQIIRESPLRDSFNHVFPEMGIKVDTAINNEKYQFFLYDILCRMTYEAKTEFGYVLEGFEISLDAINKYYNRNEFLIYALGTLNITPEEFAMNILKYDTERDWTFGMNYKDLLIFARNEIEASKRLREVCSKNNIDFYDTAQNRELVLEQILQNVSQNYKLIKAK